MEKEEIYIMLKKIVNPSNVFKDEDMKKHTSFKIGGTADFFVIAENIQEIEQIINFTNNNNIPLTIIGNGTNLLVKDNGIRGITLKINLKDIQIHTKNRVEETIIRNNKVAEQEATYENNAIVTVGAGVSLGFLAQKLMKQCISGFEFAAGIPGTIGGAITMNAGAYGREFKDIVLETKYIDCNDGKIYTINNAEHEFEYRNSIFKKNKYVILETKLLLDFVEENSKIKEKMDELLKQRKEKQPLDMPSAGSTFKRGNDFITAKLIDECGLKGYSVGDAQVSTKHSGFVVNKGSATAEDVLNLVDIIKSKVKEKFDKEIELEVEIIGE